ARLDVNRPGGGGVEVTGGVHATLPAVRFLALSVSDAAEDVIGVVRAGARGYVTKAIDGPALTDAIVRVASGDAVFGPRLAGFVLDAFSGCRPTPPSMNEEPDDSDGQNDVGDLGPVEDLAHVCPLWLLVRVIYRKIGSDCQGPRPNSCQRIVRRSAHTRPATSNVTPPPTAPTRSPMC